MRRLVRYFLQGLLFLAPIAVTVFVFYKVFMLIDEPLRGVIRGATGLDVRGLGFVVTVALGAVVLTVTGFLTSNFLTRSFMKYLDRQFDRFPIVKLLHSSVKDLLGAFVGGEKKFDRPVLVTLVPGSNVKAIGFVTRSTLEAWGMADDVGVYLPQSYNFAGNLLVVPREQVAPLRAPSGDVMAFVVSGGVSGGDEAAQRAEPPTTATRPALGRVPEGPQAPGA